MLRSLIRNGRPGVEDGIVWNWQASLIDLKSLLVIELQEIQSVGFVKLVIRSVEWLV